MDRGVFLYPRALFSSDRQSNHKNEVGAKVDQGTEDNDSYNSVKLKEIKTFSIGVLSGGIGALVGLGGAFIALPILTGALHLSQKKANGSVTPAVAATAVVGSSSYMISQDVDIAVAIIMALGGAIGARFGATYASRLSDRTLKKLLALLLLFIAPLVPLRAYFMKAIDDVKAIDGGLETKVKSLRDFVSSSLDNLVETPLKDVTKLVIVGLLAGVLTGIFGVGGGAFTVPAVALSTDLPQRAVVGTCLAAMIIPVFVGFATHLQHGNIVARVSIPLTLGTAIGSFLTAQFIGKKADQTTLAFLFSGILMMLGSRTAYQLIRSVK